MLRIIGGAWRGRKLRFPPSPEIRPTPDRVRETLFNWLMPRIVGARCLDLFAGSGALGLESLSRGAAHVTFVERDSAAVRELRARLSEWGVAGRTAPSGRNPDDRSAAKGIPRSASGATWEKPLGPDAGAQVEQSDALRFLAGRGGPYDIVFLDPPFDSDLLAAVAGRLEQGSWLAPGALIYMECAARDGLPPLPPTWVTTKAKQAGEVGYHLLTRA